MNGVRLIAIAIAITIAGPFVAGTTARADSDRVVASVESAAIGERAAWATELHWIASDDLGNTVSAGCRYRRAGTYDSVLGVATHSRHIGARFVASGELAGGRDTLAGRTNERIEAEIGGAWIPSTKFVLSGADHFLDAGALRGHVLRVQALYAPVTTWSLQGTHWESTGGNLNSYASSLRIDRNGARHWFAGIAGGRSRPELGNAPLTSDGRFRESYLGVDTGAGHTTLTWVGSMVDTGGNRQFGLSLVVALPVGRPGAGS